MGFRPDKQGPEGDHEKRNETGINDRPDFFKQEVSPSPINNQQ